ncbi:MAG: hypothetical protein QM784_25640 [Polyangiaceae bacterium]
MRKSIVFISALTFGCSGAAAVNTQARSPESRVLIARACPALKEPPPSTQLVSMFVEVADVSSIVEEPLDTWLATHPVEVSQVAHVMVPMELGKQVTAPWRDCRDPECPTETRAQLTVSASTLPGNVVTPVTLQLTFTDGREGRSVAVVTTGNQTPAVAKPTVPRGSSTVVVTPYYLFAPKDQSVEDLMQCKVRPAR